MCQKCQCSPCMSSTDWRRDLHMYVMFVIVVLQPVSLFLQYSSSSKVTWPYFLVYGCLANWAQCWNKCSTFCFPDNLDLSTIQKLLMKTGLILIVIGHLNFITSALVHGTVLRHIANPTDAISLQYAISNIISVISAILVHIFILPPRNAGWQMWFSHFVFLTPLWSRVGWGCDWFSVTQRKLHVWVVWKLGFVSPSPVF